MKKILLTVAAALTLAAPIALSASASAVTGGCALLPRCFGIRSHQPVQLELSTTGVPGSVITAQTPALRRSEDWHIGKGITSHVEWAPRGVRSHLCIAAVSDVAGSDVRLEPCQHGTAGSSHQLWTRAAIAGGVNFVNVADGLLLTVHGDVPGAHVQLRTDHADEGNRVFSPVKSEA